MSTIPIIASADELPGAIRHADRNPGARWYVAKRAATLGQAELIPESWGITASYGGDWTPPAGLAAGGKPPWLKDKDDDSKGDDKESGGEGDKAKDGEKTCSVKDCDKKATMFGKCKGHAKEGGFKKKATTASGTHDLPPGQAEGRMGGMTAAGWDTSLHPRDRKGRFIEKFDVIDIYEVSGSTTPIGRGRAVASYKGADGIDRITVERDADSGGGRIDVRVDRIESAPPAKARLDGKVPEKEQVSNTVNVPTSSKAIERLEDQYAKNEAAADRMKDGPAKTKRQEDLVAFRRRIDAEKAKLETPAPDLKAVPDLEPEGGEDDEVVGDVEAILDEGSLDEYSVEEIDSMAEHLEMIGRADLSKALYNAFTEAGGYDGEDEEGDDLDENGNPLLSRDEALARARDDDDFEYTIEQDGADPEDDDYAVTELPSVAELAGRIKSQYASADDLPQDGDEGSSDMQVAESLDIAMDGDDDEAMTVLLARINTAKDVAFPGGPDPDLNNFQLDQKATQADEDRFNKSQLERQGSDAATTGTKRLLDAVNTQGDQSQTVLNTPAPTSDPEVQKAAVKTNMFGELSDDEVLTTYNQLTTMSPDSRVTQLMGEEVIRRGLADQASNDTTTVPDGGGPATDLMPSPEPAPEPDVTSGDIGNGTLSADSDGVRLSQDSLEALEPIRGILDVDNGYGSWASGMNEWQFDSLSDAVDSYLDDPASVGDYEGERLGQVVNTADWIGADPADLIQFRKEAANLGWAQEEQLGAILRGEPLDQQNPNALRNIADFLRNSSLREWRHSDGGESPSPDELAGDIIEYLNGAFDGPEWNDDETIGAPDEVTTPPDFEGSDVERTIQLRDWLNANNKDVGPLYDALEGHTGTPEDWQKVYDALDGVTVGPNDGDMTSILDQFQALAKSHIDAPTPGQLPSDVNGVNLDPEGLKAYTDGDLKSMTESGKVGTDSISEQGKQAVADEIARRAGDATPAAPSASHDEATHKQLLLMARSADKDSVDTNRADAENDLRILIDKVHTGESDVAGAHKEMAQLMTRLKLGGKQRKRYRELLDKYFGNDSGDSASVEAATTAANLSDDSPVKERLAKKAAELGSVDWVNAMLPDDTSVAKKVAAQTDSQLLAQVDQMLAEDEPGVSASSLASWRRDDILRDLRAGEDRILVKGETEHTVNRAQAIAMLRSIGVEFSGKA